MYKWGHITIASIRGGMSMINNVLAFVSFGMFLLELLFSSSVLPRLLGVNYTKYQKVRLEISNRTFFDRGRFMAWQQRG